MGLSFASLFGNNAKGRPYFEFSAQINRNLSRTQVNTSRGPLVDPAALESAIAQGKVSGAGLDVFEPEPPDLHLPLYRSEKVIVTPHAAFVSEEALADLRTEVASQIAAVLRGEEPKNIVNRNELSNRG